jgi:hypothetical protein
MRVKSIRTDKQNKKIKTKNKKKKKKQKNININKKAMNKLTK